MVAIFQLSTFTPPTGVNLFSTRFMSFFIVLPGAMPDPRIKLPNLTKLLGEREAEIRIGRKVWSGDVGKEMAPLSPWKHRHHQLHAE